MAPKLRLAQGALVGDGPEGLWPEPGAGWWPRPRRCGNHTPTATWHVERCAACGTYRAFLRAEPIARPDMEITVLGDPMNVPLRLC